jgi:DNA processing protein
MKYLNALNIIPGVGSQKIKILLDAFGNTENIWKANLIELKKTRITDELAEKIAVEREKINPEEEWIKMEKTKIKMITVDDSNYPKLLKEIPNPPYTLYIKSAESGSALGGTFNFNESLMISIVGSRKFTQYGKQAAEKLAHDLSKAGLTIVSGLALGIDSFAHRAALEAGGKTVAVLGSSLEDDMIGPRNNFELSREIIESGALVSDYPLGTTSLPGNFPARNRLMAGMTLGTLVVEAAEDSGSLITASLALEFNREVFAVPGSIYSPQSEGTNKLIKSGAKIVTGIRDILEELKIEERAEIEKVKKIIPANPEEEKVLKVLSPDPLHIDTIAKMAKLEPSAVSSTLAIMEMKGMVRNIGGQNYIIL